MAQYFGPTSQRCFNKSRNFVAVCCTDYRTHGRARILGIANDDISNRALHFCNKLRIDGPLNIDARACKANLALIEKRSTRAGCNRPLEIGICKHHRWILATQLKGDLFKCRCSSRSDDFACFCSTSKRNKRNIVVRNERVPK